MTRHWLPVVLSFLLLGCHGASEGEIELIGRTLSLHAGSTLADIGTGDGDFLPFYASLVGELGLVYGTEIDPDLVASLRERVISDETTNVRIVQATATNTGLAESCCDVVVLRHVYHHLTDPKSTLLDMHRALRPGGVLLIIDFQPTALLAAWTPEDLPTDRSGHGITPAIITAEALSAGFELDRELSEWPGEHWIMDRFAILLKKAQDG